MPEYAPKPGSAWWTIRHDYLMSMLYRVWGGEEPEHVMIEFYANSQQEYVKKQDED